MDTWPAYLHTNGVVITSARYCFVRYVRILQLLCALNSEALYKDKIKLKTYLFSQAYSKSVCVCVHVVLLTVLLFYLLLIIF